MDSCSLFASTYKLNHRVSEAIQARPFIKDPDNLQVGKDCFVVLPLINRVKYPKLGQQSFYRNFLIIKT